MIDVDTLLAALIAVAHIPIWEETEPWIAVGCSCGWRVAPDGHLRHTYQTGDLDFTREWAQADWLKHQEGSVRLMRAAINAATVE